MELRIYLEIKRSQVNGLNDKEESLVAFVIKNAVPLPESLPLVYEGTMECVLVHGKTSKRTFEFVVDFNNYAHPKCRVTENGENVMAQTMIHENTALAPPNSQSAVVFFGSQILWIKKIASRVKPEKTLKERCRIPITEELVPMVADIFRLKSAVQ